MRVRFTRPHTEMVCAELAEDYTGTNAWYLSFSEKCIQSSVKRICILLWWIDCFRILRIFRMKNISSGVGLRKTRRTLCEKCMLRGKRNLVGTSTFYELDISRAQCVFLLIVFHNEKPEIYRRDSWSLGEYQ